MAEQGTFEEVEIAQKVVKARALGCEREKRLKGVAAAIDRKMLAATLELSYTYVSDVLNSNNEAGQKPIPHKWHGAIQMLAPDLYMKEVASFDEDVCGYQHPEKKRPLTPEEENRMFRQGLKDMKLDQHESFKHLF